MAPRQADACPYVRPFPDGFGECPAYRRSSYLAMDMEYRPLATVNTCAHLEPRSLGRREAGFYPACLVGDAAARAAWAARMRSERLARIRELARVVGEATRDASREMWEAKADQLRAIGAGRSGRGQTRRVRQAAARYEAQARRVLARRARDLEELGIDQAAVAELFREAVFEWAQRTTSFESYRPSPEVLERFPEDVRAFLSPNAP
jgi:hypothetical protein